MRKNRPNANPILGRMRDEFGGGDPWGTAIGWAFAVADVLHFAAGEPVPAEMQYRPSPVQHEVDRDLYPDAEVLDMYESGELTADDLTTAAKCLSRYLDWCKAAGLDY